MMKNGKYVAVVILFGFLISGCQKKLELKHTSVKVEVKEKLSLNAKDYFKDISSDDKVTFDKEKLNLEKLGSYPVKIRYQNKDYDITLEVVDRTVPELKLKKKHFDFYEDDTSSTVNKAIHKEMAVSDNYDEGLKKPNIISEKDIRKGELTKTVKVCDLSGNCSGSQKLWLNFKAKKQKEETIEEAVTVTEPYTQQEAPVTKAPVQEEQTASTSEKPAQKPTGDPQPKPNPNPENKEKGMDKNRPVEVYIFEDKSDKSCVSDGKFGRLGNSGRAGPEDEMDAWAWEQLKSDTGPMWKKGYRGYDAWTVYDNCGERNDIWTLSFY